MRNLFVIFSVFASSLAWAQADGNTATAKEGAWPSYGYIALGAIILILVIFILIRKQHRKFNE